MKSKKGKLFFTSVFLIVSLVFETATAFAAPRVMADGGVFDSEYYAETNPDVVAVFGTSESALYSHYKGWGEKEGRMPVDPALISYAASAAAGSGTSSDASETVSSESAVISSALLSYRITAMDVKTTKNSMIMKMDIELSNGQSYRIAFDMKKKNKGAGFSGEITEI